MWTEGWSAFAGLSTQPVTGTPKECESRAASHVAWLDWKSGTGLFVTSVDRTTHEQKRTVVGSRANPHDYTDNGSTDVLVRDASGVLWRDDLRDRPANGQIKPALRTRVGAGWQTYKQIEAVGDLAGNKAGVLWLYQGNGRGNFATRVRIGGGWGAFTQLVGAGDVDDDGRPDLIAYGAGGTYVYRSTGSTTAPFSRQSTSLYAGEGSEFNSIA
ncbi:VCBS repeat-containing protein [Streptomyces sp. SCSIO 30461]|uniref:FG-GAP repeat domain-containing protein n=1 Tax=Streptomyces sp. SCSIO 30461 TaxID=3118085 RepID=UPI0030CBF8FB